MLRYDLFSLTILGFLVTAGCQSTTAPSKPSLNLDQAKKATATFKGDFEMPPRSVKAMDVTTAKNWDGVTDLAKV